MAMTNAEKQAELRYRREKARKLVSEHSMFIKARASASKDEVAGCTQWLDIVPVIAEMVDHYDFGAYIKIKNDKIFINTYSDDDEKITITLSKEETEPHFFEWVDQDGVSVKEELTVRILEFLVACMGVAAEMEVEADAIGGEFAYAYQALLGFLAYPAVATVKMSDMMGTPPRVIKQIKEMLLNPPV